MPPPQAPRRKPVFTGTTQHDIDTGLSDTDNFWAKFFAGKDFGSAAEALNSMFSEVARNADRYELPLGCDFTCFVYDLKEAERDLRRWSAYLDRECAGAAPMDCTESCDTRRWNGSAFVES